MVFGGALEVGGATLGAIVNGLPGLSVGWLIAVSIQVIFMAPPVYRAAAALPFPGSDATAHERHCQRGRQILTAGRGRSTPDSSMNQHTVDQYLIDASRSHGVGTREKAYMRETMAGFATTIMRDVDELRRLEAEWRSLALSLAGITIFQLPEWVLTWWSYFGAGKHLYCVAVHHSGELVGFAPLMIQRRFGLRTVSFIGSPLNDHNGFVVANADAALIRQAIRQCLLEHAAEWDMIDLEYVDAHRLPEWREALASNLNKGRPRGACLALRPTPCPRMPLPLNAQDSWDHACRRSVEKI